MKNVSKFKKPLLFISTLLAFVFSFSACSDAKKKQIFYVDMYNNGYHNDVECDSFQMLSHKECDIWVGKTRMKLKGDWIVIGSYK